MDVFSKITMSMMQCQREVPDDGPEEGGTSATAANLPKGLDKIIQCSISPQSTHLKGTVSQDFLYSVFFPQTAPPGPIRDVLGPFKFFLLLG